MSFLDFSAYKPQSLTVKMPDGKEYTLKEANGEDGLAYRNAVLECTQYNDDGKPTKMKGLANVDHLLLSRLLVDSEGKSVSIQTIKGWPSSIVTRLVDKAKEISDIGGADDLDKLKEERDKLNRRIAKLEEAKLPNGQGLSTTGSD